MHFSHLKEDPPQNINITLTVLSDVSRLIFSKRLIIVPMLKVNSNHKVHA